MRAVTIGYRRRLGVGSFLLLLLMPDNARRATCYDSSGLGFWRCCKGRMGGEGSRVAVVVVVVTRVPLYSVDYAISLNRPRCQMLGTHSSNKAETAANGWDAKKDDDGTARASCKEKEGAEDARFMQTTRQRLALLRCFSGAQSRVGRDWRPRRGRCSRRVQYLCNGVGRAWQFPPGRG